MIYTERWDMILEAVLGVPATPEQKMHFENGMAETTESDRAAWDAYTPEEKAEKCVNNTHGYLVALAKQYEYNSAIRAASSGSSDLDEVLAQTAPTPAAARASKAVKPSRK